ncbi:hypothetical protein JW977_02440 [Candidatus Falkowbacteria bacterium]|nr:hypothetical protein [Candidatus Falkowbacteria bacterium]
MKKIVLSLVRGYSCTLIWAVYFSLVSVCSGNFLFAFDYGFTQALIGIAIAESFHLSIKIAVDHKARTSAVSKTTEGLA